MTWAITILAILNMAAGYCLAVFLHGKGILASPSAYRFPAPDVAAPQREHRAKEVTAGPAAKPPAAMTPTAASIGSTSPFPAQESTAAEPAEEEPQADLETPAAHEQTLTAAASAPQASESADAPETTAEASVPSEQNAEQGAEDGDVLAGIEAFRSQLAKLSSSSADDDEELAHEKVEEIAGV